MRASHRANIGIKETQNGKAIRAIALLLCIAPIMQAAHAQHAGNQIGDSTHALLALQASNTVASPRPRSRCPARRRARPTTSAT